MNIRKMTVEDYDAVYALWKSIRGFGMRSIDDSRDNIVRFIERNPDTCVVAEAEDGLCGAILCGHDGRRGCFYHVCVREDMRRQGVGRRMVLFCIDALKKEKINKVCLNAFVINQAGNAFWKSLGWTLRSDMNYYDFAINEENITVFNE